MQKQAFLAAIITITTECNVLYSLTQDYSQRPNSLRVSLCLGDGTLRLIALHVAHVVDL